MSDTPKRWAEYKAFVKATNVKAARDADAWAVKEMAEFKARPWYLKIFTMRGDVWIGVERNMREYRASLQPSIIGYYDWDSDSK